MCQYPIRYYTGSLVQKKNNKTPLLVRIRSQTQLPAKPDITVLNEVPPYMKHGQWRRGNNYVYSEQFEGRPVLKNGRTNIGTMSDKC